MKTRVLITGGTGFVGRHLIEACLRKGHDVSVLIRGRGRNSRLPSEVAVFECEPRLESVVDAVRNARPDVVVHLASYFVAEHVPSDVDKLLESNIRFGTHLLEAMAQTNVRCFVNTGTAWQNYHSETYSPVNLYAATKQAFEDLTRAYAEMRNWSVVHLKIFDTYGPGDERPKLIPKLISMLKASSDEDLLMAPGEQKIDLVHIRDVVNAFLIAIERVRNWSAKRIETFGVRTGDSLSLKDLMTRVESITGKRAPVAWGRRPYRQREIFEPWPGPRIPGWSPQVSLEEGITELMSDT